MKTNVKMILKTLISTRNYTQEVAAKEAGWKNQSSLSTAINRENPSLDTLMRIADAMDYDIVFRDRNNSNEFKIIKEDDRKER